MAAGLKGIENDDHEEITDENYLLNKFREKKECAHYDEHVTMGGYTHQEDILNEHGCHREPSSESE